MNQAIRLIKKEQARTVGTTKVKVCRARSEFKSRMVMIRYDVDSCMEEDDRERAEYIYSQLMEQAKKLSRNFGFEITNS